jgi:protein-S-isoprenylcysteine O-methyltransferase Ste14
MGYNTSKSFLKEKSRLRDSIIKRMMQVIITIVIQAAILFIASGGLHWLMAWAYIGVYVGIVIINSLFILPKDPELIAERGQIKEGTESWDKFLAGLMSAFGPAATLTVAGLDKRFGWSPQMLLPIQFIGLVLLALGFAFFSWAMASNRFFSGVVRIQEDRGHSVATAGPYRFVRHPGYVGFIISSVATPILLGSLWALIPGVLAICIIILRTALEDKTLHQHLEGYKDYAQQVRYRLFPGIW